MDFALVGSAEVYAYDRYESEMQPAKDATVLPVFLKFSVTAR